MRDFPRGLFPGTFSEGAGNAGRPYGRGSGTGGCGSHSFPGGHEGKTAYFGGINKCKFRRKVVPGDKLRLETKIIRRKGPVGIGSAVASVDGEVAVEAELTFMIG